MSGISSSPLDQAVKGAAPLGTSSAGILSSRPGTPATKVSETTSQLKPQAESDPLVTLPSTPPQIYLNMLILEASLRSQFLTLRDRRRQNTFWILCLTLWTAYFFWALFLAPREDGSGIGGSVYWVVETYQKVALMGGIVTMILIWGTGQWERGVRRPRRFIVTTNRGLRSMNCKIVLLKGPWWREMLGHLAFLFPWREMLGSREMSDFRHIEDLGRFSSEKGKAHGHGHRQSRNSIHLGDGLQYVKGEDLSPGGDLIKLLLLPKPFSPEFRENWELYRTEYWERENERRVQLRQKLKQLDREKAREESGWLWWTGWKGWHGRKASDPEKRHTRTSSERETRRVTEVKRGESHSRNASRSGLASEDRPGSRHSRTGSHATDGRRRSARNSMSGTATGTTSGVGKRSSLAAPPLTTGEDMTGTTAIEG